MGPLMDLFQQLIHVVLHLDVYINNWVGVLGVGVYFVIFLVIFAETGLVVTPFLPGDSFLFALGALLVAGLAAQAPDPDIAGRWTGVADTTDEAGTKRQEKQTVEIRKEDGKLTGFRIGRDGKPGPAMDVQQSGAKVNLYFYLDFEGGEPLRWKLELKDGKLVGTFSAQHHRPSKWIYDRVGAITMSKDEAK